MILDWLLRHHRKEEDMPQLDQKNEATEQQQSDAPAVEQPQEGTDVPKMSEALDAEPVKQEQLSIAASGNIALAAPGSIKIEAPTGFAKPEFIQPADGAHTHGLGQLVGQHSHSLSLSDAYASIAKESAVDKLESDFQARIFHIRTLLNHLGQEAEAEVMALFDKYPVTAKNGS